MISDPCRATYNKPAPVMPNTAIGPCAKCSRRSRLPMDAQGNPRKDALCFTCTLWLNPTPAYDRKPKPAPKPKRKAQDKHAYNKAYYAARREKRLAQALAWYHKNKKPRTKAKTGGAVAAKA